MDYYEDPNVRARMVEFLGGRSLADATAVYISGSSPWPVERYLPDEVGALWSILERGCEVGRSLWDRRSLLVHIDLDYHNSEFPGEAYLNPTRVFELLRPATETLLAILRGFGIAPLHLLSGRGHHFVWRVWRESRAFGMLSRLGRTPEPLMSRYLTETDVTGEKVGRELGEAYSGLALTLEHLALRVRDECVSSRLPIELTDARKNGHGEIAVIDLSEYGDPVSGRTTRLPYSMYLKPFQQRGAIGEHVVSLLPRLWFVTIEEGGELQAMAAMRDEAMARELAASTRAEIPEFSAQTEAMVEEYACSPLADFHNAFYSVEQVPPEDWPSTYDRLPVWTLPLPAMTAIEKPNDLLLKPTCIREVVFALLDQGWHPRHIAGLIRSKYERDFGWGDRWYRDDATSRAEFYTRLFAASAVMGGDALTARAPAGAAT